LIDDAVEKYSGQRINYQAFTEKLRPLLEGLLKDEGIRYSWLESRTKTIQSFRAKIREKSYKNPFADVTDLCGLRIIVCYPHEVADVGELVEREFAVDRKNSTSKLDQLKPNQLGYLDVKYVVSLDPQRAGLSEWKDFRRMKAEIQVRTLPQHTWATVDEKLRYKKQSDLPEDVLRRLFRVAGLLELADQEIQAIRDRATTLVESYPHTPISVWTINSYFAGQGTPSQVERDASRAGFLADEGDPANANELADACFRVGIVNLALLEGFLFQLGGVRSRFFDQAGALIGSPGWKSGPILSTLMLMYGRWPRRFTSAYLKERGWATKAIRIIRSAGRSSGLVSLRVRLKLQPAS
jgi:ppGpp synthetase/RelA/SpoT-type nucleotidyltranferase